MILSSPRLSAAIVLLSQLLAAHPSNAQEASSGVVMPFSVTAGLSRSDRSQAADPGAYSTTAGFRAVFYPSLKINSDWFVYSAVQFHSQPHYYYDLFYPDRKVESQVQQLYIGYSRVGEASALGFKLGRLPSAFGSFPLRYDDTANPLLDQPFSYAYPVKLRPDQLPCGADDLLHQETYPLYVNHYCGGSSQERNGMVPVTLYGLPGLEIDWGWNRFDARFQLTNSSPVNPQGLTSASQHLQWTAGAGYTLWQGFRIGASGFRGPFLENGVHSLLDPGTGVGDYPAVGLGADLQWGLGRWSLNAEWHRVEFNYPVFEIPPAVSSTYVEVKATLNPRLYLAFRGGYEGHGPVQDNGGARSDRFQPDRQSYELVLSYRLNRVQSLKFGYEWLKTTGVSQSRDNVLGVHFVTSIHSLSKAF